MSDSKSTVLLEAERADRFGPARAGAYMIWTREQGDKLRATQHEQSQHTTEEGNGGSPSEEETIARIRQKFNE